MGLAVDADAVGARIQHHRPAGQFGLGMACRPAQQRANAGENLFEMKRLGDIIVGAGIEALHLVAPAVPRGQDQHRHGALVAPPRLQHRNAVHLGKPDVEHHGVVGLAVAEEVPLLPIECAVYDIACVGQGRRELAVEIGIVFNNKKAQRRLQWQACDSLT